MKNSGNEANKYLKTKDITFLHAAICAHFKSGFAQIEHQKEQKTAHSAQMKPRNPGGKVRLNSDKLSATSPFDFQLSIFRFCWRLK